MSFVLQSHLCRDGCRSSGEDVIDQPNGLVFLGCGCSSKDASHVGATSAAIEMMLAEARHGSLQHGSRWFTQLCRDFSRD
tara:strand:- start:629 stop:868 length:240 start_codon:yes stop_codon:yes gene_type:complete